MKALILTAVLLLVGSAAAQKDHFASLINRKAHLSTYLDSLHLGDTVYLQAGKNNEFPANQHNVQFDRDSTFHKVRFRSWCRYKWGKYVMSASKSLAPSGTWSRKDSLITISYVEMIWRLKIVATEKKKITFVLIE